MPTFSQTMKKEFKKSDQTLTEFMEEFKGLTEEDKKWYYEAFLAEGIETDAPREKKTASA